MIKAAGVFESPLTSCHTKLFVGENGSNLSFIAVQEFRNIQKTFNPHTS